MIGPTHKSPRFVGWPLLLQQPLSIVSASTAAHLYHTYCHDSLCRTHIRRAPVIRIGVSCQTVIKLHLNTDRWYEIELVVVDRSHIPNGAVATRLVSSIIYCVCVVFPLGHANHTV